MDNLNEQITKNMRNQTIINDNPIQSKSYHKYRGDIDGLRAYAIFFVILSHYYNFSFKGGIIGVDIFFVISGYLISTSIYKEYQQDQSFNYTNFYTKRIKRLFPAIIVMLSFNFIIMCVFMDPQTLKQNARSMLASCLMAQNFEVFIQIYIQKKMLFTCTSNLWSLGVEQQFYMIMPMLSGILILFCSKKGSIILLSMLILISIVLSVLLQSFIKQIGYYLPFTRFYQLGAGCLLSLIQFQTLSVDSNYLPVNLKHCNNQNDIIDHTDKSTLCRRTFSLDGISSIVGAIIIIVCIYYFDYKGYPTYKGIFPAFATVLIIRTNTGIINQYLLNNRVAVFFGKISYSLYLFHYQQLIFQRYYFNRKINFVITIFLAIVVTFLIQNNIRFGKIDFTLILILLMLVLLSLSISAYINPVFWSMVR